MTVSALAQADYRIRTGDTLQIEVLEDASLNRASVVLPDGRIAFPFVGTLKARGSTIGQIQRQIVAGLSPNFANPPTVFVSVVPAAPTPVSRAPVAPVMINVYFVGEVNSPGRKEMEPGSTVLQALAVGGGFTRFAATKRVQLRRTDTKSGRQQVFGINYKAIADGQSVQDIPLLDGDVIVVPQRRLFE
jgi:polysaccharide export outer membrane protein